jgi:hypothetical protein
VTVDCDLGLPYYDEYNVRYDVYHPKGKLRSGKDYLSRFVSLPGQAN